MSRDLTTRFTECLTDAVFEERARAFQRVVTSQPHTNGGHMMGDPAEVSRLGHAAGRDVVIAALSCVIADIEREHEAALRKARAFAEAAAAKYNDLVAACAKDTVLTCAFCGAAYPSGTPHHGDDLLVAHIKECPAHPLRALHSLLNSALNGWGCYAKRAIEHNEIRRIRDEVERLLAPPPAKLAAEEQK